jgi:hypothetical protein
VELGAENKRLQGRVEALEIEVRIYSIKYLKLNSVSGRESPKMVELGAENKRLQSRVEALENEVRI